MVAFTALFFVASHAGAQAITGSIAGSTIDATGAAVPGAAVTVRNTGLSTTRTVESDRAGSFRISGVVSGTYTIEAKADKLALPRPVRVTLSLGSSIEVTLKLEIPRAHASATVRGRGAMIEGNTVAPPSNTAEAAVTTFFPGLTVTYLPNRDRNFTQFTDQTPGADEDANGGVTIAGQRANAVATEVDGVSFDDPLLGGPRGAGDGGVYLPIGVVSEFQLVPSGVDSGVGLTNAGLINVATKGGANRMRGDAFYTVRPTPFTSADAFGRSLDALLNSFGFSESGPIRKNALFYSAGFEQDFVHDPYYATFAPQNPSGPAVPGVLAAQQGEIVEKQSPTAGFGRLDWVMSQRNTLTAAVILDRIRSTNAGDGLTRTLAVPTYASNFGGQSTSARLGLTTVLGTRAFNQATLAYANDHRTRTPLSSAPELFINGFGVLGGDSMGLHRYTSQQWQLIDDVMLTRGRNEFKFGGRFAASPAYEEREPNLNARFDYNSLTDYLNDNPRRFQQTIPIDGFPRYQGTAGDLGLYANARIALRPKLFVTAGLRWEGQWNPQPPTAASGIMPVIAAPAAIGEYTQHIPNDLKQWQPRLGLAWSPSGKTTLRLSSGLYDAPTPATFFHRVFTDGGSETYTLDSYFDPSLIALSGGNTASPHAIGPSLPSLSTYYAQVAGISPAFRNPASFQAAASIEQQVNAKLDFMLGYMRNSTWGLERELDENLNPPVGSLDGNPVFPSTRPIAGVGRLLVEQSTAHSSYDGGYVSVRAPISARSTLMANYTLSRTEDDDDSTNPYSPVTAVNPFSLRQERGYSLLDARNTLSLNAIFNLPVGFKANPLFVAHSGVPYTPIVGFDTSNDANDLNDRANVNGVLATRNSMRQPAFSSLDMRFVKDFTLKGEGHHLDLFMDVFNVAGAGNRSFDPLGMSYCGDAASPVYSALTPLFAPGVTRQGGPRTAQFTVRLVGF
ncbi:MAG: carboxypeptidase regulatory-like domain-containing protein [Terracidiphilus sp.]